MTKVCIIGAGIGGLATASYLAKAGFDVHVYEKEPKPGGRAGKLSVRGFTFDTGPSWYLMPDVFEHFFALMDEPVEEWLRLKKLTPAYKVFYEKGEPITITSDIEQDARTFEDIEIGAGKALKKYVTRSDQIYQLSLRHFLYTNFEKKSDLLNRNIAKKAHILPTLLLRPIDSYVNSFVRNTRLKQILEYPMVFLGTSPFSAPAMYSLMSALDFKEGVYYPQGGMYTIIESIEKIAIKHGVTFHYERETIKINTHTDRATSITLNDKTIVTADIVISNADMHHTETVMLDVNNRSFDASYWQRKEAGPSALLMYLGVEGKVPEFEHHTLLFADDWKQNFDAIYHDGKFPHPASIYISKTSGTDPSTAPRRNENIFILVPLPSGVEIASAELNDLADKYIAQIETMTGVQLANRLLVKELFGPNDFRTKYYSWRSSMLGQSHLLRQSAFFRTPNKSKKVKNLYYVGGSTMPGIGLPMCLIGAELVYKRIIGDSKGGRVVKIQSVMGES